MCHLRGYRENCRIEFSLWKQVHKPGFVEGDHLSSVRVASDLMRPLPEESAGSFSLFLFGLAPDGVCQASASLRSWWSFTSPFQLCVRLCLSRRGFAFSFLWHFPWDLSPSPLASILPCGARTFLPRTCKGDHLTYFQLIISYHHGESKEIVGGVLDPVHFVNISTCRPS